MFSISKKIINKHLRFKTERNFWQGRVKPELAKPHLLEGTYLASSPKALEKGFTAVIKPEASGCQRIVTPSSRFQKTCQGEVSLPGGCSTRTRHQQERFRPRFTLTSMPRILHMRAVGSAPQNECLWFCRSKGGHSPPAFVGALGLDYYYYCWWWCCYHCCGMNQVWLRCGFQIALSLEIKVEGSLNDFLKRMGCRYGMLFENPSLYIFGKILGKSLPQPMP